VTQGHRHRRLAVAAALGLAVLAVGAGSSPAGAARTPQEKVLSHLLCYLGKFRPPFTGPTISLTDEIGTVSVNVLNSNIWCNPVKTTYRGEATKIVDVDQHMKHYNLQAVAGTSMDALVSNQFGADQEITLNVPPTAVLVPTKKAGYGRPKGLSHFECHNVNASAILNKTVRLKDEFREYRRVKITQQWLQCLPAEKTHGSVTTPIVHPTATLACYLTERLGSGKKQPFFRTINQFETRKAKAEVNPGVTFHLCVPSTFEPVP
jgi:hypothetical protein